MDQGTRPENSRTEPQLQPTLKHFFKGAATTVICRAGKDDPLYQHYQQLLDGGTKPNLAKLTISRQIASIVLAVWRSKGEYDRETLSPTT